MLQMINEKELRALAQKWRDLAMKQVPAAYAERGLHGKYFRLDNEAAGLDSCADELLELLDTQRSLTPRAADQAAIELLRRFYDAWQAREDDEVIDALVLEMSAVLKTAAGG